MALSVRPKLTLWYIGTVTLLLAFFIGADVVGLRRNLISRADTILNHAADALAGHVENAPGEWHRDGEERSRATRLLHGHLGGQRALATAFERGASEPAFLYSSTGAPIAEMTAAFRTEECSDLPELVDLAGEPHRLVCRRVTGPDGIEYQVTVALSVADRLAAWRQALWEHALLALGLVLVVSLVTYVVIRRAFRPVRQLTETARTITAEDLSRRVDAAGDRYEIGELAATLNDVIARLEGAFEREKRFSGDVAHELNTPLTVLRGEIELALRKKRSAQGYQETLRNLLAEVDRLNEIVANLLLLSRVEARDLPARMDGVALDDVVLTAYEQLQPIAQQRSVRFELEEVAEVCVRGDADLLERLVANLLSNGIKFTPDGGEVAVTLRARNGQFTLTVVDSGPGIPESDLSRVFDRFYRVDKSRSKRTGGAGLGLAIVREIANGHGFDVRAANRHEGGAELRVVGATSIAG